MVRERLSANTGKIFYGQNVGTHTNSNNYVIQLHVYVLFPLDKSECGADTCKNGGKCVDLINDFECECTGDFSGKTCERSKYHYNTSGLMDVRTCTCYALYHENDYTKF